MYQKLNKKADGFTIIEVLIVLAIAGLIMLIVFLAVPALQRNSRNNARNNDASRIASAITECLANRNGQTTSCGVTEVEAAVGTRSQLTTITNTISAGSTSSANFAYGLKCNPDGGSWTNQGAGQREFVVLFQIETSGNPVQRCIGG